MTNSSFFFIFVLFLSFFFSQTLCLRESSHHLTKSQDLKTTIKARTLGYKVSLYFNADYESKKSSAICQIPGDQIDRLYYGYLIYTAGTCRFNNPMAETYYGPKTGVCGDALQTGGDQFYGDIYQLMKFKQKYPHVKVFLSLGGPYTSNSVNLHSVLYSESSINSLVSSCMSLYNKYSTIFDGFDLDMEYPCLPADTKCGPNGLYFSPTPNDKSAMSSLINALKIQLGVKPLSIMLSADTYKLDAIDFITIDSLIDHYNIKNFDITAGNFPGDTVSGFHTLLNALSPDPLYSRTTAGGFVALFYLLNKGLNSLKINMGTPFHGRGFQINPGTVDTTNGFLNANGGLGNALYEYNVFDYRQIKNSILTSSNSFYNRGDQASYIYNQATGMFISYESVESALEKVKFVKRYRMQGVVAWEFAGDTSNNELLITLNKDPFV